MRTGHVLTKALALVAIGLLVSLADAWIRGPIQTGLRANPKREAPAQVDQTNEPAQANDEPPVEGYSSPPLAADSMDEELPLEFGIDVAFPLWERMTSAGDVQFIDARSPDKFVEGHIPMSFWMGTDAFDGAIPDAIDMLDPGAITVVYCTGGTCHDAEHVGIQLQNFGFSSVHVFTGGMPAWIEAGHPVEPGPDMLGQPVGY